MKNQREAMFVGTKAPFVGEGRRIENETRVGFLVPAGEFLPEPGDGIDLGKTGDMEIIKKYLPVGGRIAQEDTLVVLSQVMDEFGKHRTTSQVSVAEIHEKATKSIQDREFYSHPDVLSSTEINRWSNTLKCIENFGVWTEQPSNPKVKPFFDKTNGIVFNVKIIDSGDRYGRGDVLVNDREQLIEFYDQRYKHDAEGQFVSRYYTETLMGSNDPQDPTLVNKATFGLDLYGGDNDWKICAETMMKITSWVSEMKNAANLSKQRAPSQPGMGM